MGGEAGPLTPGEDVLVHERIRRLVAPHTGAHTFSLTQLDT